MRSLLNPASTSPIIGDVVLLAARVSVGIILIAHGWQKFNEWTIDGTSASFESMGVPAPSVTAPVVAGLELIGGVMLILGLLTPIVAALNAISMMSALVLVHAAAGVFVDAGGYELVLALFASLVILAGLGAGRLSIDRLISPARKRSRR